MSSTISPMTVSLTITEPMLQTTPSGQKTLELIREGTANGYLKQKSVEKFLKKWTMIAKPHGTCFGQASAVMIADKGAGKGQEKTIVERASHVDATAFQLLEQMKAATMNSLIQTSAVTGEKLLDKPDMQELANKEKETLNSNPQTANNLKEAHKLLNKQNEVAGKIEKATKKSTQGNKKAKKKLKKLVKKEKKVQDQAKVINKGVEKATFVGTRLIFHNKTQATKIFHEKINTAQRALIEEQGGFQFVEEKTYSADGAEKKLKELCVDRSQNLALRMCYFNKLLVHAVALFTNPRLSLYDANTGMTTFEGAEKLIEIALKGSIGVKPDGYILEIFKRK